MSAVSPSAAATRFCIPRQRVAHETLDGEVVILDQEAGTYFSLTGAGADIWALIEAGVAPEAIAPALAARSDVPEAQVAEAVQAIVAQLVDERLLEMADAEAGAGAAAPGGDKKVWVAPRLERFDDLQTLLVLDPIHDVDTAGWPNKAPDPR